MKVGARRDHRRSGVLLTALGIGLGGWIVQAALQSGPAAVALSAEERAVPLIDPHGDPQGHARQARRAEVQRRFEQAVVMLHAKQYDHAITALHRVLEMEPTMPEAHVNMGYALMGLGKPAAARDFFEGALALRPEQANAYYGLALSHEAQGEPEAAIGAMRTYVHRARGESEAHLRKARAALWEWESRQAAAKTTERP